MANFIQWLSNKRAIHILLTVSYFLLVVLPHEQVGLLVVHIFQAYTRDTYNLVVLIVGLVGLATYFIPVLKHINNGEDKPLKLFYLITTLLFIIVAFNLLVIVNIEIIHFLQYGVMAILLFPLTQRYGETLFWTTLLGAIDEAYQYFYLAPERTEYYDFNDVIINLLGGVLGLIFLRSMSLGRIGFKTLELRVIPVLVLSVLSTVVFILWKIKILFVYPPIEPMTDIILLVKKIPAGFWSVVHPEITYHVVLPFEGIVIIVLLFFFYSGLGRKTISIK